MESDVLAISEIVFSVVTRAPAASAAHALYLLVFFELLTRYTANACAVEVRLLRLNATEAAKLLITLLLPFGDQIRICVAVLEKPIVKLLADGFLFIVEIVDVS